MSHHSNLSAIRKTVRTVLRTRAPTFSAEDIRESILLDSLRVVGHQFRYNECAIQWLSKANELRVYVRDEWVQTIDLNNIRRDQAA